MRSRIDREVDEVLRHVVDVPGSCSVPGCKLPPAFLVTGCIGQRCEHGRRGVEVVASYPCLVHLAEGQHSVAMLGAGTAVDPIEDLAEVLDDLRMFLRTVVR